MRAALPVHPADVDQPEVRLVDERRRLKAVALPFAGHARVGDAVEFPLHERNEPTEGGIVPLAPGEEQRRDVVVGHRNARSLLPFLAGSRFRPEIPPSVVEGYTSLTTKRAARDADRRRSEKEK